jgi:hypothetical protein
VRRQAGALLEGAAAEAPMVVMVTVPPEVFGPRTAPRPRLPPKAGLVRANSSSRVRGSSL